MELDGEDYWRQLAEKQWASRSRRARPEVIKKEIWDKLESSNFDFRWLRLLENLQLLEKYLWPGYDDDASNQHVMLLALMVMVKSRDGLPAWNEFTAEPSSFSSFFSRVLSLTIDTSLSMNLRAYLLDFLISAFLSLDNGIIRKECAPLVSISLWHHLDSKMARDRLFKQHVQLQKAWRAAAKRYEAGGATAQAKIKFERSWLFSMIADFINRMYEPSDLNTIIYCERFLEFLTNLESQLPTRRYLNTLIRDLNLIAIVQLSPVFCSEENALFRDLFVLFRHFVDFPIDDQTGIQLTPEKSYGAHCERLAQLQRTSLRHMKAKLTILALSNYGAIESRSELKFHLVQLTESELSNLCTTLNFRTEYPASMKVVVDRELLLEILLTRYEKRKVFQEFLSDLSILPTEADLYDEALLRNEHYDGSRSLAIPKLNLQYLSVGDFLWRSFVLYRAEAFFEVRKDMEDSIKRLQPQLVGMENEVQMKGFSKTALPISIPSIVEVAPPKVGADEPAYVRVEIALDVGNLADNVRREWDSLRPDDVVFLLSVRPQNDSSTVLNGHTSILGGRASGILYLRAAEVVQVLDDNGRTLRDASLQQTNGHTHRPRTRRLIANVDAAAYKADEDRKAKGKPSVFDTLNVIVRRRGRENNFKRILESIKSLGLSHLPLPEWFHDVFLGYGDPAGATYTRLGNALKTIDFRDTFIDWQHLVESLPGKSIVPDGNAGQEFNPPYVLEALASPASPLPKPSKKRRRNEPEKAEPSTPTIKVSTYKPPNNGPFITDLPKTNATRFTPMQVEAIISGTQPGLTVIVGPPGTGKTDVAAQIINNIYHDFPSERTLMIAHSNQALNQLFQKITKLDIDGRHLLRLGHGEEDLDTDTSYGKYGRVESFLDNRAQLLAEVDRLAQCLDAPGAHGNSCETAGYFRQVYIDPAWSRFWKAVKTEDIGGSEFDKVFPFHQYFGNAPQPLFPSDAPREHLLDVAQGCERHINNIFTELEDIRPFEILRSSRGKANYLLIKEARIIAMTSTHAAMRRQEIAGLGFHYDNVIMEEAAQITEIENFIPLVLQNAKDGIMPLQRIVLCGDHLQNSPIIQNLAFRQYANLEQGLFLRLVRLGVPVIELDKQGRARPSIAELYKWRYENLSDLPNVLNGPEYQQANAGFRYEYQFINVPDYKGAGEMQPSPHFIQNLGEAEYAVAIYQYMRLLGYPAASISILTTYAGQRALVRDVLTHRCAKNRLFGLPKIVTTVDKYQGEQNDYIILSLTRTNRVGYLRDIRRLTVALSRARLGLYILGRRSVFENCYELKSAFEILLTRSDTLQLVPGELFPTHRTLNDEVQSTEMTGVEHLGQYVYEITQAKVKSMGGSVVREIEEVGNMEVDEVNVEEEDDDGDVVVQPEENDEDE